MSKISNILYFVTFIMKFKDAFLKSIEKSFGEIFYNSLFETLNTKSGKNDLHSAQRRVLGCKNNIVSSDDNVIMLFIFLFI